jgi:hypothetical protein
MKFEQNFPNLLDMAVGVERVHAAPVWNAQATGEGGDDAVVAAAGADGSDDQGNK